jgi:hypothetical protein
VRKKNQRRLVLAIGLAALAGLLLAACGGGSSTLAQAEKEQAERHGRELAQEKAKEQRLERKLEKLERENRQAKKRHREKERAELKAQKEGDSAPPPSSSTSTGTASALSGTDCGGGTVAGPETSCGFALETRAEYEREIGAGSGEIEAWSQANEQWYGMYCTEGARHECSGAISATVSWP